tara:strand:- start:3868 stop:4059 length:192 start_codon:yes stop_codon:yes gene_type:complete
MSKLKESHPLKRLEKNKGDTEITIPTYIRHNVFETDTGVDIIIVSGEMGNECLMKIKCRKPKS